MSTAPVQVLTVSEFTRRVKGLLENHFPTIWIEGELSNVTLAPSGHAYFTLKDSGAQLPVVMFRNNASRLPFRLADGLQVLACGQVSVYERRGQYQLIATQLQPKGFGALQLAFEQLKQKLAAEGLFDPARKKPLPRFPQRIALVTSPAGAAIRDFLNIIGRRFPNLHLVIYPVRVQGAGAAAEIAAAIDDLNVLHKAGTLPFDVLIVTRGGGSLEDLWAFNEEIVARALARSSIPTISAVGHEIDFTISDFVADLRAPTPSAAAELVIRPKAEFQADLTQLQKRLTKDLRLRLGDARQRYIELANSYVFRQPAELIRQYQQRGDDLAHRLHQAVAVALQTCRSRLRAIKLVTPQAKLAHDRDRLGARAQQLTALGAQGCRLFRQRLREAHARLELLSPNATLGRGYSITRRADGRIVRGIAQVAPGETVTTLLLDGQFASVVTSPPTPHENQEDTRA